MGFHTLVATCFSTDKGVHIINVCHCICGANLTQISMNRATRHEDVCEPLFIIPGSHDSLFPHISACLPGPEMLPHSLEPLPYLSSHKVLTWSQKIYSRLQLLLCQTIDCLAAGTCFFPKSTVLLLLAWMEVVMVVTRTYWYCFFHSVLLMSLQCWASNVCKAMTTYRVTVAGGGSSSRSKSVVAA